MNLENIKNIHFVGIGGIGMSGIADILASTGHSVSGCDLKPSPATVLLQNRGIPVSIGHAPAHVEQADALVVTAAVRGANDELDAARRKGIPVIRRSEMLGEIASTRRTIGVAGTHGKTTTSAMIATILQEAGLDPTIIVGGILRNMDSNARAGRGEFLVVEADEYDRTFHHLHPEIAVVTNIEADHLEYYGTFEAIVEAFSVFLAGIKPEGSIVACIDDPHVARVMASVRSHVIGYGLSEGAEVRAINLEFHERGSSFEVPGLGFFKLFVPGKHNVCNALAAIAVAKQLGVDVATVATALARFLGVDRRFQILGEYLGAIVVDDYAHHPTEIRATLDAARRGYPERRVVALFQPHLYSRTRDFAREFADALRVADVAIVAPIYAAREQEVDGISARLISEAAEGIEYLDRSNVEIFHELRNRLEPTDIFISMGAGDVHEIAEMLARGDA